MVLLRRTLGWLLIIAGGFVLVALTLNLVADPPEGSHQRLERKALVTAGLMLGVCPILLGSLLRRKARPRAKSSDDNGSILQITPAVAVPAPVAGATTPTDPRTVACSVTLTQHDLTDFQYWLYHQRFWRLAVLFTAMSVVVTTIHVAQNGGTVRLALLIPFILLIVGILMLSPYWAGRSQFRRSAAIRQVIHYEFSPAGLRMRTNDSDSTCGWTTVPEAYESARAILLLAQPNLYRIVPKSALAAGDLPRFRQLLSEQLGKGWHPRRTTLDDAVDW